MITRVLFAALLVGTIAIAASTTTSPASSTRFVAVTTAGEAGVREGTQFYPLGMAEDEFIHRFGEPMKREGDHLAYPDEGLEIGVRDGKITAYIFMVDEETNLKGDVIHRSADVATDGGVDKSTTFRGVAKAQGKPDAEFSEEDGGILVYPFGSIWIRHLHLYRIVVGFGDLTHDQFVDMLERVKKTRQKKS